MASPGEPRGPKMNTLYEGQILGDRLPNQQGAPCFTKGWLKNSGSRGGTEAGNLRCVCGGGGLGGTLSQDSTK